MIIWQRYFLKETLKLFAFILFGFYFLYLLFDSSFHIQDFIKDKRIQIFDFFLYYMHLFIKRADLLVPLSLLVATIKVLTTLNANRELLALQVAGLNFQKLTRPFFLVAALVTLFNFVSIEFFFPRSAAYLDAFRNTHFKHADRGHRKLRGHKHKEKIKVVHLKDRSKLVYQYYDGTQEAFFDVVWIRKADDIWRIKFLYQKETSFTGEYVDHFVRNTEGFFEKRESFKQRLFPELKWNGQIQGEGGFIPFENRKVSELISASNKRAISSYEKAEIATNALFKCVMSLVPFLVILAITPFCFHYSRSQGRVFFLYSFGIFGYIAFYLGMNSATILGENLALTPFLAIFLPFGIPALYFGCHYYKKC